MNERQAITVYMPSEAGPYFQRAVRCVQPMRHFRPPVLPPLEGFYLLIPFNCGSHSVLHGFVDQLVFINFPDYAQKFSAYHCYTRSGHQSANDLSQRYFRSTASKSTAKSRRSVTRLLQRIVKNECRRGVELYGATRSGAADKPAPNAATFSPGRGLVRCHSACCSHPSQGISLL